MVTRDAVEKLVGERLEQLESGRVAGDAKNRALSLKLRQPSQRQEEPVKEDIQQLRQDLVVELRDMKEQLRASNAMNTQLLQELRSLALARQPAKVEVEEAKEAPPKEAPPKDVREELSEEQKGELQAVLSELVAAYENAKDQTELLKRIKIPIQSGAKTPTARKVDINSGMFKGVFDKHPDAVAKFFLAIGFTSTSPTRYEFLRPAPAFEEGEANAFTGNVEVLETMTKLIEGELAKLPQ